MKKKRFISFSFYLLLLVSIILFYLLCPSNSWAPDLTTAFPTAETPYVITLTNANTAYARALPSICFGYCVQARTSVAIYVVNTNASAWYTADGTNDMTATETYWTIKAGGSWCKTGVILSSVTLYFQSATAGTVVEVIADQ